MTATSLAQLTRGEYFKLSPLAAKIAFIVSELDKSVELSLCIEIVKELDFLLQCPSSGRIVDGVRWIWETYKDWRDKRFPYHKEYRVRKAIDALKQAGILLMKQFDLRQPYFHRKAYWRLNYEKLETIATPRRVDSEEPQTETEIEVEEETSTHLDMRPVRTDATTTYSTFSIQPNADNNVIASGISFEEEVDEEELLVLEVKVEEVKECINRNSFNYAGALLELKRQIFKRNCNNPTGFFLKALRNGWGKNSAAKLNNLKQNLEPTEEQMRSLVSWCGEEKLVKAIVPNEELGYPFVWCMDMGAFELPWWEVLSWAEGLKASQE